MTLAETELERSIPQRIKAATAEFDQKKAEYERLRALVGDRAVSKSDYDKDETEFKQAEAELWLAKVRHLAAGFRHRSFTNAWRTPVKFD